MFGPISCRRVCLKTNNSLYVQRVVETRNQVVITDRMWARLLGSTNQPSFLDRQDLIADKIEEAPQTPSTNGDKKEETFTPLENGNSHSAPKAAEAK